MRDWMNKLVYCKCPCCGRNGIKAFGKIGYRINPAVSCKYCEKRFRVNWALSFLGKILITIIFGLCGLLLKSVGFPLWFWCVLVVVAYGLFEYFAPMETVDPLDTSDRFS